MRKFSERVRTYILPHAQRTAHFGKRTTPAYWFGDSYAPLKSTFLPDGLRVIRREAHVVFTGASAFDVVPTTLNVSIEPAEANTSVAGGFRRSLARGAHGSASVCVGSVEITAVAVREVSWAEANSHARRAGTECSRVSSAIVCGEHNDPLNTGLCQNVAKSEAHRRTRDYKYEAAPICLNTILSLPHLHPPSPHIHLSSCSCLRSLLSSRLRWPPPTSGPMVRFSCALSPCLTFRFRSHCSSSRRDPH